MGMITGSSRVNFLPGQTCLTGRVRPHHVGFVPAIHRAAAPLAGPHRPHARWPAGPR
jgi:hypothetical protein